MLQDPFENLLLCCPFDSLVLVNFRKEGGATVQVVLGHAVEQVRILQAADQETVERLQAFFLPPATPRLSPEELRRRRSNIRIWLLKNQVPVEEEGDHLRVAGVLTVAAPYRAEDCCSSNQIILDRIQNLIRNLVLEGTDLESELESSL